MVFKRGWKKIATGLVLTALFWSAGCPPLPARECADFLAELDGLKGTMERQSFLREALRQCPDDHLLNYFYGLNQERLTRYDAALTCYRKAVRLDPGFARGYFGLGDIHFAGERFEEAVEAYAKGLSLEPDNIWARRSLERAEEQVKIRKTSSLFKEKEIVSAGGEPEKTGSAAAVPGQVIESGGGPAGEPAMSALPAGQAGDAGMAGTPPAGPEVAEESARGFIDRMVRTATGPEVGGEGPIFRLQVRFHLSSNELTPEAMEKLDAIVCRALQSEELEESRFEIAGHTDDSGSFEHNMYLSRLRAYSVRDYLVDSCGIDPERLTVVYYGPLKPAVPNINRHNRQLNRRVEFRKLP